MTSVRELIDQLQRNHELDEPIVFQYFVADYTSYGKPKFERLANYLMNNESFGEESTNFFLSWLTEADDILKQVEN